MYKSHLENASSSLNNIHLMSHSFQKDISIPKTQRIAIFEQKGGPVQVKDAPAVQQVELKPGQVLVKLLYSGVCHTDLHVMLGDWPLASKVPCIGGHEGSGYVVAIGDGTPEGDVKVGDAVGIKWLADSCLSCEQCNKGHESTCSSALCSGFTVDGTFQQYAVSYARHVTPIPDGLALDLAAPILCAGVTVWKAIKTAQLTPGETLVISGAGGGLGHLAIQYALAIGLRVIALDTGEDKKKLCESLGADCFIDFATSKDLVSDIKKATGGLGAHGALVSASSAKAYEEALDYLRGGGVLVAVGLPADAYIKANVFYTVLREIRIIGSYVGNRMDAKEALDFAARGKVKVTYALRPLGDLPKVFDELKEGKINGRVVLDLWK